MTQKADMFMGVVRNFAVNASYAAKGKFDKLVYDQTMEKVNTILTYHTIELFTDLLNGTITPHLFLRAAFGHMDDFGARADDEMCQRYIRDIGFSDEDKPTSVVYLRNVESSRLYMVWELPRPTAQPGVDCYVKQIDRIFQLWERYHLDVIAYENYNRVLGDTRIAVLIHTPASR